MPHLRKERNNKLEAHLFLIKINRSSRRLGGSPRRSSSRRMAGLPGPDDNVHTLGDLQLLPGWLALLEEGQHIHCKVQISSGLAAD